MLRISLLGGFLIEHEGKSLPPISSTAGRSLLAYLITYRARQHTRDLLSGTFWPERSESSARKRLSQALWQIHTALRSAGADESLIEVTTSQVSFNAAEESYWLDVEEFEQLVNVDRNERLELGTSIEALERATSLYRGDFLAGFYDDWMLLERTRLSDLYLQALERLVSLHKARSDYRSALTWARRVVLEDQMRESGHREVMRLNFLLGRSTEALQQYEHCVAILREELSVEPSAKTKRLRDEIIQLRDKGERAFVPSIDAPLIGDPRRIPFVGRTIERTALVRRIEDTLVGRGGVVLVEGESGIGKTRFLNELVKDAHWRGVDVLWAQGDQSTELRPYHIIGQALSSGVTRLRARQLIEVLDETYLPGLARVSPEIADLATGLDSPSLPPDEEQTKMRKSIEETLLALGEIGAHVLLIDDAHWTDAESLQVLESLMDKVPDLGLLILLAYRSEEARDQQKVWQTLRLIDEKSHPDRVTLGGLDIRNTSHLIDEASGAVIPLSVSEGIFYETGGNPLFILETLRHMHESSSEILDEGSPLQHAHVGALASGVARVIKSRLSNLDAKTRIVLNAAAILGSHFDASLLTRMSRLESSETLQGLSQLVHRGILIEAREGYEFSHQQMRTVAEGMLTPRSRRRLHREASVALEAEHPERIEDLAYHYAQADMAKQAMRLAWQAGSRAVTLASYESAARYLRDGVEWARRCEPAQAEFFELLCDLETTLDVIGERQEQIHSIDIMDDVAAGDAEMVAEAKRRRASVLAELGQHIEALQTSEHALKSAEQTEDDEVISAVERTIGIIHSLAGSPAEAIPHLERAVDLIAGRSVEEAEVRQALGDVLADLQRYDAASTHLAASLTLYEESGNLRGVVDAKGLLGVISMERGEADRAEDLYRQALEGARKLRHRRAEAVNLANLANVHYFRGRISDALDEYVEAGERFIAIGDRRSAALSQTNAASVRHLILGDDEQAEEEARSAMDFFESEAHDWGRAFCLEILAGVAERRGDRLGAEAMLRQGLDLVGGSQHRWLEVHLLRHLSETELAAGDFDAATDLIERAENLCSELGMTDVLPTVVGVASQVALATGRKESALHLARRATDSLTDAAERPFVVWYQRYVVEEAVGRPSEAEKALKEAWRLLNETLSGVSVRSREQTLTKVPAIRDIQSSWRRTWPETIAVRLPRDDVPTGRQLEKEDHIALQWTIREPADYDISAPIARRRHRLSRLIAEAKQHGATPRVSDLATALGVSPATLRRDLVALRGAGRPLATRGTQARQTTGG